MKLIKDIDNLTASKLKKSYFAGRLTTNAEAIKWSIGDPIHLQDDLNEVFFFYITCLSEMPEAISKSFLYQYQIFKGTTRHNVNVQKIKQKIPNFDRLFPAEKKEKLLSILEDKLIIFSLYHVNMMVYLEIVKIEDVNPKDSYIMIPQPNLRLNQGRENLEQYIMEGKPISLTNYPNLFDHPEFLYYDNYLYSNLNFKPADVPTTYYVSNPDSVKRLQVSHDFFDHVDSRIESSLLIVDQKTILDLRDQFDSDGLILWDVFQSSTDGKIVDISSDSEIDADLSVKEQLNAKPFIFHEDENDFIERLEQNAQIRGLYYDSEDLLNLHISLKTNFLTIIGGMSGTGKSQMARLYGESLDLKMGETMVMVPVSPSYHEPNDILGYLNATTGVYHESETGLVSLLLRAQQYRDQLHMVIFDEMNLSQVEHWFSPFISLLEIEANQRWLSIFNKTSFCINDKYQSQIQLHDNLIFVGTINFDDTTKGFSDRLLDRTNLIVPRKLSFTEVRSRQIPHHGSNLIHTFQINMGTFRGEWLNPIGELDALTEQEVKLLDIIHELIEKQNRQSGVSFRIVKSIGRYLANIPLDKHGTPLLMRSVAFDLQLKQRVFTKISGSESVIGDLVGTFQGDQYVEGTIAKTLLSAEFQQMGSFRYSLDEIKQKAKELMTHGYTN